MLAGKANSKLLSCRLLPPLLFLLREPHGARLQQAVLEEQGFQCAFCMSGFIMNTVALLNENQNPTRKEAAEWLSGNLCRCADYDKILTSVERAAAITREA